MRDVVCMYDCIETRRVGITRERTENNNNNNNHSTKNTRRKIATVHKKGIV